MIFAPVIRRAAYAQAPRSADLALQRFVMGALAQPASSAAAPAAGCTVTQDEKATTLQLDVPGLAREQLSISIEGQVVQVHLLAEGASAAADQAADDSVDRSAWIAALTDSAFHAQPLEPGQRVHGPLAVGGRRSQRADRPEVLRRPARDHRVDLV